MGFTESLQKAQGAIKQFKDDNKNNDKRFTEAGSAFEESLNQFVSANEAFKNGDTMGGAASVLKGMGSISGTLSLAFGPAGVAIGSVLNALLGVISAILDALKPPSDSLISKIEKLIMEESLRNTRDEVKAGLDAWRLVEIQIDGWLQSDEVITWDYLTQTLPSLNSHYLRVLKVFNALDSHTRAHTDEWLAVFELNVVYTLRFWTYYESLGVLVGKKRATLKELQPSGNLEVANAGDVSAIIYFNSRRQVAKSLAEALVAVHYPSVVEVEFYALWLSAGKVPYVPGRGNQNIQANPIYRRIGMMNGASMEKVTNGESACYTVVPGGTIFSVGTSPTTLYYGRTGSDWEMVPAAAFAGKVDQVATVDWETDYYTVVVVHDKGTKISNNLFNDHSGTEHETVHNGWTPGKWRWGRENWSSHDVPAGLCILAAAVQPLTKEYWRMYAFAVDANGNGALYNVQFAEATRVTMEKIEGTDINKAEIASYTNGVAPSVGRDEISPCTISFQAGDGVFLQVGNWVRIKEYGKWHTWNLRDFFQEEDLNVYQARYYDDGSIVFSTNKGVYLRYNHPIQGWKTYKDTSIQTIWFSKTVASQALTARELIPQLEAVAQQSIVKKEKELV